MAYKLALKASVAAVALGLCASASAFNLVQVDFTGSGNPGSSVVADNLDWNQANVLFQGLLPTAAAPGATPVNILGHGTGLFKIGNTSLNPAGIEITYVFGVPAIAQIATSIGTTDFTAHLAAAGGGFFKAYIDTTPDANNLTGTGFDDGDLLFEGTFNVQSVIASLTIARACVATSTCALLDQFAGDSLGGVRTVDVGGSTNYTINITSQNNDYIINNISTFSVTNDDQTFNTSTLTPFKEVDPSKLFRNVTDTGDVAPVYGVVGLTKINGTCGGAACDVHVQGDASSAFEASQVVPEPGTVALLGLGLGVFGLMRSRRSKV